jgi:hypothetical protein
VLAHRRTRKHDESKHRWRWRGAYIHAKNIPPSRGLLCLLPSCISLLLSSPPLLVMLLLPPPLSLALCLRLRLRPLTRLLLFYSMAIIVLTPLRNAFASTALFSRVSNAS